MHGSYDPTLVLASYCVAVIASHIALYFGTKLFDIQGPARQFWLWTGSLCLGSGIWSMHFVGMSAYTMPHGMEMSFSLPLTALSWVPAVLASALALAVISRPEVRPRSIVASAVIMGAGISYMHYGGMYAMRMHPQISYDPALFALSILIAVAASWAALMICRKVREVPSRYVFITKAVAALVMGLAICGMHYTGMAAAEYADHATLPADNLLRGNWMGIPTAIVTGVFLLVALVVAIQDFREIERAARQKEEREAWIDQAALHDPVSGLSNRQHFERQLLKRIARGDQEGAFMLVCLELGSYRDLLARKGEPAADDLVRAASSALKQYMPQDSLLARYARNCVMGIVPLLNPEQLQGIMDGIELELSKTAHAEEFGEWSFGHSRYPEAGNSRTLINQARGLALVPA